MKKSLRFLALILALVTLVATFAACNSDEDTDDEDNESESVVDEFFPDIAKKDYGSDFFITSQTDSNTMKYHWVEESDGDGLSEAIYLRQEQVRKHLGVEITAKQASHHTTYAIDFQTAVKNKDDSVQLLMSHVHSGIEALISGGYLADFNDFDSIDLDAHYWNQEFMEGLAIDDMMFLGNSNFNILYTYVIAFNKTMLEQQEDALEESIYDIVTDYRWTLDRMISLASLVSIDATSDGKTEDDTFGLTGVQWVPFVGFLNASNIQLVDIAEDGNYKLSFYDALNQAKTTALIGKLADLAKADYAWFRYRIEDTPEVNLQTGRTLMELKSTNHLPILCDSDVDFGVLPYPMYDEAQKDVGYRHLQWGGYLCIPSYLSDPTMVGDTIEMLSYYSTNVNVAFYEKLLGKQVADLPDDRKMLNMIWDSVCSDFGQTYTEIAGVLYMVPELTHQADPNMSSFYSGRESSANKAIRRFIATTKKKYGN